MGHQSGEDSVLTGRSLRGGTMRSRHSRSASGGNAAGNVHRSRHALNADKVREMHAAFRRGGRKAIEKVMRNQPAVFLKLLVLLVPRQITLDHSGGVQGDDRRAA
jgi:hypothetical protein